MKNGSSQSYKNLYEQPELWSRALTPEGLRRVTTTLSMVPLSVRTVLEVGCGNGVLANQLAEHGLTVIGLDASEEALRHVRTRKVLADASQIPFPDRSFDLVLCAEVLEHVPPQVYNDVTSELVRVTDRYLLLSVPFRENPALRMARCKACGNTYNLDGHVRSFKGIGDLKANFPDFETDDVRLVGALNQYEGSLLLFLKQRLARDWAADPTVACPQCGKPSSENRCRPRPALKWFLDRVGWRLLGRPFPHWIVCILERKNHAR